jgi:FKBP-type peptidyl-prolyl cis-trans isomerase
MKRSFVLACLALAACLPNDSTEPLPQAETELVDQVWASSLGVNLSAMTLLPSGVYVLDTTVGGGAALAGTPTIRVYYTGFFANGRKFDGNVGNASPAIFLLGQLIEGWKVGLQGMKVGGKRRLVIPSRLAYGPNGQGASIPPNSNLVFDIELVSIN